jgi:hypothetical protein
VELSDAKEVAIAQAAPDRVLIEWRCEQEVFVREFRADDGEFIDPEDVLWLLLRHETPEPLVRQAMGASFPDFDIDDEIAHITMPDRAARRRDDHERRQSLRAQFKASREEG